MDKNIYLATILFADMVGCSEISNNSGVTEYNKILSQFHIIANEVKDKILNDYSRDKIEFKVCGDETCIILHSGKPYSQDDRNLPSIEDSSEDIKNIIRFALALKLKWLISDYNKERMRNFLTPRNLGIGIHLGQVVYEERKWSENKASEGYAINLAKRIEGASRKGEYWSIFLSEPVKQVLKSLNTSFDFDSVDLPEQFKGITTPPKIYELKDIPTEKRGE